MTDRLVLRRRESATPDHELARGEYRQVPREWSYGHLAHTTIRCPDCGSLSCLPRRVFHVDASGVVDRALICPGFECMWRAEGLVFDGWIPEAAGSA